jgi:hypothetical protein
MLEYRAFALDVLIRVLSLDVHLAPYFALSPNLPTALVLGPSWLLRGQIFENTSSPRPFLSFKFGFHFSKP